MARFDRTLYDFLLVSHCNYSCLVSFASYLTLNNIATLKLAYRLLKVIETGAIQKLGCGFLLDFYSKYGRICSRL